MERDLKLNVIYEDNHLLVINKPPKILSQGDQTGDTSVPEMTEHYLREKYNKPGNVFVGLPHRLDRPVSGVMVLTKTSKALDRMNLLFKKREVQKTYWAIVENKPPKAQDKLVHYLIKDTQRNKVTAFPTERPESKRAELDYKHIKSLNRYELLEVYPKTGRSHQIRVQLASMGCIIKGDLKYGAKRSNPDASISLHARKIEFIHPVKNELINFTADPPDDTIWNDCL